MAFKQRTVVDPSTRLFREAEVRLQQEQAAVRDQERQDQTQIQALKNADIQLTKNEVYFLKSHEKMWNAVLGLLGPGGEVQKAYINWGRDQAAKGAIEGNDEYDDDRDDIPDTRVTTALKTEQNIQGANAVISSRQESNVKSGELWAEKNHWYKSGAQRAYAARSAADFEIDLPSYLESSEDQLTYTDSQGNQIPFEVKNYQDIKGTPKPYAVAVREYAAQRIASLVESGLSAEFVAEKIVPLINKQAATSIKNYNIAWNKADAWEQITKAKDQIHDSINLGTTPLEETIVAQREVLAAQMKRLGKEKPYVEADKQLKTIILAAFKAKHGRGGDFRKDLAKIEQIKFKFPWLKDPATLGEAKPEDFDSEVWASDARKIETNLFNELESNKKANASNGVKAIDKMVVDGAPAEAVIEATAAWTQKFAEDFPDLHKKLLDRSNLQKPTKTGFAWANQIIKEKKKISSLQLAQLNSETIEMLKEKHGDIEKWYEDIPIEEQISEKGLKAAKEIIDGGLNQVLERSSKLDAENGTVARVEQYVYSQIPVVMRDVIADFKLETGRDLSTEEGGYDVAAKMAATKIEKLILEANADPNATQMLTATPTEGFKFFDTKAGTHRLQTQIQQGAQTVKSAIRMREENYVLKDPLLSKKLDNIPDDKWDLTNTDELKPFWRHLGAISGTDPVEIYKSQAQLHQISGLKEPKVWEGQELINDKIDGNAITIVRKNAENTHTLSNGIDNAGGVSPVSLLPAFNMSTPEQISSWTETVKNAGQIPTRNIFIRKIGITSLGLDSNAVDSAGVPLYRSLEKMPNGQTYASFTAERLREYYTGGLRI